MSPVKIFRKEVQSFFGKVVGLFKLLKQNHDVAKLPKKLLLKNYNV